MDDRGFTLLELLVAMLLVGILAAIALPDSERSTDFNIEKLGPGAFGRTCGVSVAGARGEGGCPSSGSW